MRLLTRAEYETLAINESYDSYKNSINENIRYHIENQLTISDSIFRVGSESYLDFINEMRKLHSEKKIRISEDDQFILEKLYTGKKGTFTDPDTGKKQTVSLDDPHIRAKNEPSKSLFIVYRPTPSGEKDKDTGLIKAIAIGFGEDPGGGKPDVRDKHQDPGKRAQFLARHNCKEKDDPYASGWWSCNIHKFYKQLGLKTADPW
jgi:hypothetical protein